MAKLKSTKKALVSSMISLLLSCAMLFGTTFAWFTDNTTSSNNRIISGDLEIDLLMYKTEKEKYVSIAGGSGDIFAEANGGNGVTWQPDKTEIVYLAVKNIGTLALKYNIKLDIIDSGLADALEYAILDGVKAGDVTPTDWTAIKSYQGAQKSKLKAGLITVKQNGILTPEDNNIYYFAIAVHMPDNAEEYFQDKSVTVDLNIMATQAPYEEDSFGKKYDENAKFEEPKESLVVTPSNIKNIDFTKDNAVYKFSGKFDTVKIQTKAGLNQIFDGSDIKGDAKVILYSPGVLDSYESLSGEKKGRYTVTGFEAKQIEIYAYDTTVNIIGNKAEFIHVSGANLDLNISGNEIDGKFETHDISENNTQSDHGVYLYVTDYDLEFTNNTVTDTKSHAIGINGRQAETTEFVTAGENNVISAFSGNTITVNSETETESAVLKIWDCAKYAPIESTELNTNAQELTELIKTENTYNIGETHVYFDFNDVKVSEIE